MQRLAVRNSFRLSKGFVLSKMIVESDSRRVINRLSIAQSDSSYLNNIIEDCCCLMSCDFEDIVFNHVG